MCYLRTNAHFTPIFCEVQRMITQKWQNISIMMWKNTFTMIKETAAWCQKKMPEMQKCVSANMVGIFLKGKGNLWMRRRVNFRVEKPFLSIAFEEALESPTILRRLSSSFQPSYYWNMKSVNLQYNTLGCLDDGTNESSTKRLMFQVLFFFHDFLQNSLQKSFQFIFLFFL